MSREGRCRECGNTNGEHLTSCSQSPERLQVGGLVPDELERLLAEVRDYGRKRGQYMRTEHATIILHGGDDRSRTTISTDGDFGRRLVALVNAGLPIVRESSKGGPFGIVESIREHLSKPETRTRCLTFTPEELREIMTALMEAGFRG